MNKDKLLEFIRPSALKLIILFGIVIFSGAAFGCCSLPQEQGVTCYSDCCPCLNPITWPFMYLAGKPSQKAIISNIQFLFSLSYWYLLSCVAVLFIKKLKFFERRNKIIAISLFLILAAGISYITLKYNPYPKQQYWLGEITVTFTDEASWSEVIGLIESKELTYEGTRYLPESIAAPVDKEIIPQIIMKLENYEEVVSVTQPPWELENDLINVEFIRGIKKSEAENVLTKENITMQSFNRKAYFKVFVPDGEEYKYIEEFKISPLVDYSVTNERIYITD
jgi:hypothetical protein